MIRIPSSSGTVRTKNEGNGRCLELDRWREDARRLWDVEGTPRLAAASRRAMVWLSIVCHIRACEGATTMIECIYCTRHHRTSNALFPSSPAANLPFHVGCSAPLIYTVYSGTASESDRACACQRLEEAGLLNALIEALIWIVACGLVSCRLDARYRKGACTVRPPGSWCML